MLFLAMVIVVDDLHDEVSAYNHVKPLFKTWVLTMRLCMWFIPNPAGALFYRKEAHRLPDT